MLDINVDYFAIIRNIISKLTQSYSNNINFLTKSINEYFSTDMVLYTRLSGNKLFIVSAWENLSHDGKVVNENELDIRILDNDDIHVFSMDNFSTCIRCNIYCCNKIIGFLYLFYINKYEMNVLEQNILRIIATLIGREESYEEITNKNVTNWALAEELINLRISNKYLYPFNRESKKALVQAVALMEGNK
jgi:hypothetical protein